VTRPPLTEDGTGAPDTGRPPSLWRNRDFNLVWTGQCLSDLGGAMTDPALPPLVLQQTGSRCCSCWATRSCVLCC
jgi:hypothetical protein